MLPLQPETKMISDEKPQGSKFSGALRLFVIKVKSLRYEGLI